MAEEKNHCLQCKKVITKGRPDKKFCNDGCKNLYHNAQKIREHTEIKKVDTLLKRNRRILQRLFHTKTELCMVDREQLLKAGFDFNFHTHYIVTHFHKNEFTFCYDYGYRNVSEGKYRIIKAY